ncbi:deoxyribodipyrimidine photo-lyase [Fusobacterium sp. MFO224]|uniref:deoxyribodipyrimidine photo-lyase n=1 Tax=Fusobacterium sp. MFO224 TaxID=3378070 RepID=UPI0038553C3C
MIEIIKENSKLKKGHIVYWMQGSQRTIYNYALEYSIGLANTYKAPVYVFFNYIGDYPEAQKRHFDFMLQGLLDVKLNLLKRGIELIILDGKLEENLKEICKNARYLIWDKAYLKFQKSQRENLKKVISCNIVEIEDNVLIPVEEVSSKEEYSARTLRLKYSRLLSDINSEFFLNEYNHDFETLKDIHNMADEILPKKKEPLDGNFIGGEEEAIERLEYFIEENLKNYDKSSPENDYSSKLSPYLHFGQISPRYIYNEIKKIRTSREQRDKFLEQLLIRRELAFNFVYYNDKYDEWAGITYKWAYDSLEIHSKDKREYIYSLDELENFKTHDNYWNAAQKEMVYTGFMNNYMRMYWGKKIIEWSKSPREAYKHMIYLNNKYFYDGRDPNSYAGVAWCFGKHDRAWKERSIFGKIRYMNSNGLTRKFNMELYTKKIDKVLEGDR